MAHIFELVNQLFAQVVPVADFLWDFPTNIDAYANIPILGQLSIHFCFFLEEVCILLYVLVLCR